jgi:UDP-2,3-diacylglucosamine pyrophosphatase LpxH
MEMVEPSKLDAIIISDIHLGGDACQAEKILKFLTEINKGVRSTLRLIINGDAFESWDFRRLKKFHWKVLGELRSLSDHVEVIWVEGNHDGPAEIISHLLGIQVVSQFVLRSGNKTILILHGHQFDKFISDHPIITIITDFLYGLLQKMDRSLWAARMVKRASKTYLRCAMLIRDRAIVYAEKTKCDIVCCGHTHHESAEEIYFNSGCWTDAICSFLEVGNGQIELRQFN